MYDLALGAAAMPFRNSACRLSEVHQPRAHAALARCGGVVSPVLVRGQLRLLEQRTAGVVATDERSSSVGEAHLEGRRLSWDQRRQYNVRRTSRTCWPR